MKGLAPLFIGLFATFAFSWLGLTVIPNAQIGHLDPETNPQDENDMYPLPPSGMAERGRHVYVSNGCMYCHSQQIRPDYISADIDRKWGERRSAPRDYVFARPVVLGKMRIGPDLSNIGKRAPAEDANAAQPGASPGASPNAQPSPAGSTSSPAPAPNAPNKPAQPPPNQPPGPSQATSADTAGNSGDPPAYSAAWHHKHLYAPRSVDPDSIMPGFKFLYEKRRISGETSADAVKLSGRAAPPEGFEVVPTYDAKCLVAFLMSLDQSHPLTEVKNTAAPAPAAASPASPAPAKEAKK
ncbi:MAG: cytochrome c oxidase cbb3-type subunit [Verrucomicrobiota bacterium]|jgi:cytochrome c oxidase cbb3-type subunit 2